MSTKRLKFCSFNNCENSSENCDESFFSFRKHDFKIWVGACNNDRLKKYTQKTLMSRYYVCSQHFQPSDYTKILAPFKTSLRQNAVPKSIKNADNSVTPESFASLLEKSSNEINQQFEPDVQSLGRILIKTSLSEAEVSSSNGLFERDTAVERSHNLSIDTLQKYTRKDHSYIRQRHTSSPVRNVDSCNGENGSNEVLKENKSLEEIKSNGTPLPKSTTLLSRQFSLNTSDMEPEITSRSSFLNLLSSPSILVASSTSTVFTSSSSISNTSLLASTSSPSTSTCSPSMSTSGPSISTSGPSTFTSSLLMSTSSPLMSTSSPLLSTSSPSTSTSSPSKSTSSPSKSTSSPSKSTSSPSTSASSPSTSASSPLTSTSSPLTSISSPIMSTSSPLTSTSSPLTSTSSPLTSTSSPLVSTSSPLASTSSLLMSTPSSWTSNPSSMTSNPSSMTSNPSSLTSSSSIHASSTLSSVVITSATSTPSINPSNDSKIDITPIKQNNNPFTYKVLSLSPTMLVPIRFVPPNMNSPVSVSTKVTEKSVISDLKKAVQMEKECSKAYKKKIEMLENKLTKLKSRPCPKCKKRSAKDLQNRNNPKFTKPPIPFNPKRFPIEQFCHKYGDMLGPYITEVVRMQLTKNRLKVMRYSRAQLWLAASIMKGVERYGYSYLIRLFPFPVKETILRELERKKKDPYCKYEILWFDNLVDDDLNEYTNRNDNAEVTDSLNTSENVGDETAMKEHCANHFIFDWQTGQISSSAHQKVTSKKHSENIKSNCDKNSAVRELNKKQTEDGTKLQKSVKNGKSVETKINKKRKRINLGPENEREKYLQKRVREINYKRKRSLAAHLKRKKFKPLWSLYETNDNNLDTLVTKDLPPDGLDIVFETVDQIRKNLVNSTTEESRDKIVDVINNESSPIDSNFVFEGFADNIANAVDKSGNSKLGEFTYKEFAFKPNEREITGQVAYQKSEIENVDLP